MAEDSYIVVLITASSSEESRLLAERILVQRKAACVNIVPGVNSTFWWKNKIDSALEHLLVVKTRMAQLEDIIALVKKHHSYDIPEVVALPIVGGNPEYLRWLDQEARDKDGS